MANDPARLYSQLLNTGIQQKDNPMYQFLYQLITDVLALNKTVVASGASGGGSSTVVNILGFPPLSLEDGGEDGPIGPPGINGTNGTNGTNGSNGVNGSPGLDGNDGEDSLMIPGPIGPAGPMVPYYIAPTETFTVPLYKQALFAETIDDEGYLEVFGDLIMVNGPIPPTVNNTFAQTFEEYNDSILNAADKPLSPWWMLTGTYNTATVTDTGTKNDYAPGLRGNTLVRLNNATLLTITGIAGGYDGQVVTFVSIGAGLVHFTHQGAGSIAANRLTNTATTGVTPLAAGSGVASYQYDATTGTWRLVNHEQGAWITPAFDAAEFSSSFGVLTWTVDAGDVASLGFILKGKTLTRAILLNTTSTGGVGPDNLLYTPSAPYAYQALAAVSLVFMWAGVIDSGTYYAGRAFVAGGNPFIGFQHYDGTGFAAGAVNNTYIFATITYGVD